MLLDIRPDHLQIVQAILQKHIPEHDVWAFGSRAKWTAEDYSDLDLCVITQEPLSFKILGAMAEDFSESDLPWKVDVVDWSTTNESFQRIIEKDKVVVQKGLKGRRMGSEWQSVGRVSGSACAPEGITRQAGAESEANVGSRSANPTYAVEWPLVRIGQHVNACLGKMLDAKKNKGTPQPYLGNSNVRWGEFDLADLAEMRFEPHEEERYSLCPGDLVVCEGGEPGRCAIWAGPKGMKIQKALHRIRSKETLDNHYLFYWFRHAAKTGLLEPYFTGTTIKHLTGKAIAALEVPLPPIGVQRAMVDVLRRLDDRIALLRETNATLEAIAQALFKSWFVDFNPVHAKQQGREPEGMDADTVALFPDSFEESELGLVPMGWNVVSIGDVVEIVGGGTPNTKETEYWEPSEFAWTTPKDLSGLHSPVLLKTERLLSAKGLSKVSSGLLPIGTLLLSSRAPIGYLAMAQIPLAINQGYIAFLPSSQLAPLYMYFWCKQNMEVIKSRSNGSTFMEISKKAFREIPAVFPPLELLNNFLEVAGLIFDKLAENEKQAQTLTTLRDALLPRLISGQLRLTDAADPLGAI